MDIVLFRDRPQISFLILSEFKRIKQLLFFLKLLENLRFLVIWRGEGGGGKLIDLLKLD